MGVSSCRNTKSNCCGEHEQLAEAPWPPEEGSTGAAVAVISDAAAAAACASSALVVLICAAVVSVVGIKELVAHISCQTCSFAVDALIYHAQETNVTEEEEQTKKK